MSYRPYIGLMVPTVPNTVGLTEALLSGFDVDSFADFPYATILYYATDGSRAQTEESVSAFLAASVDASSRCFVAGYTTNQFSTALELFQGTNVLVLSIGSTYSRIGDFPNIENGYSLGYSDKYVSQCLVNIMASLVDEFRLYPPIYIVYDETSLYATGFKDDMIEALNSVQKNGPELFGSYPFVPGSLGPVIEEIQKTFSVYDILVYIGPTDDLAEQIDVLNTRFPDPFFLYLSDSADGFDLPIKSTIYTTVAVSKYSIYTPNTKALYTSIYRLNHSLTSFASYLVPFGFDAARQLVYLTSLSIEINPTTFLYRVSDAFYQSAALQSNWVIQSEHRPAFGYYFNLSALDTEWSDYVSTFTPFVLGSSLVLPSSCAVQNIMGFSGSQLPGGYYVETVIWEQVFNKRGDWIFTRLPCNGFTIDTSIPYRNNNQTSVSSGVYTFVSTINQNSVFILRSLINTIDFINDKCQIYKYPIKIQSIQLSI